MVERPVRKQSFNVDCKVENQLYDLYTCPANVRAEVIFLLLVNASTNSSASAYWYDASKAYTSNLLTGKNLASGETHIYNSGFSLVLEAGDKLQIKPTNNVSPHIDAVCTVLETFVPV